MGSGPSNAESRVLQALAGPTLAADDPLASAVFDDVASLSRQVFQAAGNCGLAVPGASRSGIESVVASVVEPGDRVIVGVYGHFGELLCTLASRHGAQVERVEAEWGDAVALDVLVDRVRARPPKLVAIVHADTSTGVLQPLAGLGAACRDAGSLLLVDAVLSLGGCQVNVADWHVDAAVAGLQKCLGGPPGLALVSYSERLLDAVSGRATSPRSAYLDVARLHHAWRHPSSTGVPRMLFAGREALRMVLEEGLESRWQRHARASHALRVGLAAMGLSIFGNPETRVPMITLVPVLDGIAEAGVRAQLLEEHAIEIMAAFGPLQGKVWRIGTMGRNASLPSVLAVLAGLESVLASHGARLDRGAAVDAARSAWSA